MRNVFLAHKTKKKIIIFNKACYRFFQKIALKSFNGNSKKLKTQIYIINTQQII